MMAEATMLEASLRTLDRLRAARLTAVAAESCTGGLLSAALTEHPGSSDVVAGGFVTYSNRMKHRLLGVPEDMLERVGAVSAEVAASMAEGALRNSDADVSVSITGVAGPGGGTVAKPVGLVWLGYARSGRPASTERHLFSGSRADIRAHSVLSALALLQSLAG